MRYEAKMMPVFLIVYLSNDEQHFTEVPVTLQTLCRDVVELCKEPGESDCYLAEMWRGSERVVGESEPMLEVLQRWGHQRPDVRFFLRHERAPGCDAGGSRAQEHVAKRNGMKTGSDRRMENGVVPPHMDMTLAELQDMASRQQQQIHAQQQLLASKEQRLRYLKQQDQQQATEQEKLQRLRENAENQEVKLKTVRSLRGQVEQKRLSNGKLVEEIEQMNSLFQQKQRELLVAVSKVEELSRQLEMLKNSRLDTFHDHQSSAAELERLYQELQLRNKLNQEQTAKLQEQRESLNKRNLEVVAMDKRVNDLRERLWKKKAALQQKENLPVLTDGHLPQQAGISRVAAVCPYVQFSTMPRGPLRHDLSVKPAYPDGTSTLPMQDAPVKGQTRNAPGAPSKAALGVGPQPAKLVDWSSSSTESKDSHAPAASTKASPGQEDLDMPKKDDKRTLPVAAFKGSELPANILFHNQSCEDLRDVQNTVKGLVKVPPPVPSKPKPKGSLPNQSVYGKPSLTTGTFPGKAGSLYPRGLMAPKQEVPPAAAVRPFTPELSGSKDPGAQPFHKPQMVAASSIYSMYTQQGGKSLQHTVQGSLPRMQGRVYGKPVIPGSGPQSQSPDGGNQERTVEMEVDRGGATLAVESQEAERIPRPLSPTKLLPFISNPYRHQSDVELEALRRKLYHAPRPLKKRSSITEPEAPSGPNIQKLLYQKTTLAAMETVMGTPFYQPHVEEEAAGVSHGGEATPSNGAVTSLTPDLSHPSLVPGSDSEDADPRKPLPSLMPGQDGFANLAAGAHEGEEQEPSLPPPPPPPPPPPAPPPEALVEEYPPYPPPPYPSSGDQDALGEDAFNMQPPEVTGQVTLPPGKRTNLRKVGSERIDHGMRVKFNPLALLLDSSLEGEYDLVQRIIYEVEDPSLPNDEGITALHNAVCAGHTEIVNFLVQFGVNVNAADSDGWTPLHCAASCNNVQVCKFLVESGAAVFAATYSDMQTAADKCEEMEEGYAQCSQFLYGVQEKMGVMNRAVVYGLWDYERENEDELDFREGDCMTVVRREDEDEVEWWWARRGEEEGYVPRNLLGLYPRVTPRQRSLA